MNSVNKMDLRTIFLERATLYMICIFVYIVSFLDLSIQYLHL